MNLDSTEIERSTSKIFDKIYNWWEQFVINTPNIILSIIILAITYILAKQAYKVTSKLLRKRALREAAKNVIAYFVGSIVFLLGALLMLYVLNLDNFMKTLLGAAGVAGLAISLALQGSLSLICLQGCNFLL